MMETVGSALKDSQIVQDTLYATGANNFQNQGKAAIVTAMLTLSPPLTTRPKTGESLVAFRRRRLRVANCLQWSENENVRAPQLQVDVTINEHSNNHHTHKICVDDFPVNASTERKKQLKWLTPATIHAEQENCQIYHLSEGLGGEGKRKLKDGSSTNLSDVSNEGSLTGLKSLTKRRQAKPVEEPAAIHQAFNETHVCEISKEKQAPSTSSSMDRFTWRLGRNERLCRENLDMIDSLSWNACKDPDMMKRAMISNWVIDVVRER